MINETIKAEVGRIIFLSYFITKKKITDQIKKTRRKEIPIDDFWKNIKIRLQRHQRRIQQFNRIDVIIDNIHDKLLTSVPFDKIKNMNKKKLLVLDIIECTLFQIEAELFKFQTDFNNYLYRKEFNCHQANWEMICQNSSMGYTLNINTSCAKSKCPKRLDILERIFNNHKAYFQKILQTQKVTKENKEIRPDKKLIRTLTRLTEFFELNKSDTLSFTSKPCWNLGDLLISLLVNEFTWLYSSNFNHFYFLLCLRELEEKLIPYN